MVDNLAQTTQWLTPILTLICLTQYAPTVFHAILFPPFSCTICAQSFSHHFCERFVQTLAPYKATPRGQFCSPVLFTLIPPNCHANNISILCIYRYYVCIANNINILCTHTHTLTHSLTHSLTHPPTHPHTHTPTHYTLEAASSCACQSWVLLPWFHQLSAVPLVPVR
jgi:hypothetical protein